MEKIVVHTLFT